LFFKNVIHPFSASKKLEGARESEGLTPDVLNATLDGKELIDSRSGWITSGGGIVCKYRTEG
jgi:hypothetical protein